MVDVVDEPLQVAAVLVEDARGEFDFAGAAALYGRLAEYFPDQPKILTPLADSLRRTGAEKPRRIEGTGRAPRPSGDATRRTR